MNQVEKNMLHEGAWNSVFAADLKWTHRMKSSSFFAERYQISIYLTRSESARDESAYRFLVADQS